MSTSAQTSKSYLFKLSVPIFFSNIAIPFAGLVDTGLMGHLDNAKFLAAISVATSVITMIFWSFGFLRMGTVGLVAQASGRKDHSEIIYILVRCKPTSQNMLYYCQCPIFFFDGQNKR